jgi:hypothetical protein
MPQGTSLKTTEFGNTIIKLINETK